MFFIFSFHCIQIFNVSDVIRNTSAKSKQDMNVALSVLICKPNFIGKILEIKNQKIPPILEFPKSSLCFLCFQYYRDMRNFVQISTIFVLFNKIEI